MNIRLTGLFDTVFIISVMRDIKIPNSKPKLNLLGAAEGLFAERGFDAVSVRDITQAAKANVAAVNYHFGSREGMVALVISRYMSPINEERLLRLDALEKKKGAAPLNDILDAFVRPVLNSAKQSDLPEQTYCMLVGRIFAMGGDAFPVDVENQLQECVQRYAKVLGKALPLVDKEELIWRLHFVMGSLIHALMHQETMDRLSGGLSGKPSMEVLLSRFVRFAAAGLQEGVEVEVAETKGKKGPQATFDF